MITQAQRTLLLLAVAPCLLAGSACAGVRGPGAAQPGPAVSVSPTPGSEASVSPTPGAKAAACTAADLSLKVGGSGVAAGTWSALLVFTNRSSAACELTGYPTVLGVANTGSTTRAAEVSGTMNGLDVTGTPSVTLAPGAKAGMDVSGLDGTGCPPPYQELRVTPPGGGQPLSVGTYLAALSVNMPSCGGLRVSAVHPLADFSFTVTST